MRIGAGIPGTHKLGTVNADRVRDAIRRVASGGSSKGFSNTVESIRNDTLRPEIMMKIVQRLGAMAFIPGLHGFSADEVENSKWRMGS